jgi:hypothetical protein
MYLLTLAISLSFQFVFQLPASPTGLATMVQAARDRRAKVVGYPVKPVTEYLAEYKDKHRIIRKAVDDSGQPPAERIAMYEREMGKLKDQFRKIRRSDYETSSVEVIKGHSCTNGRRGEVADCGWKCAESPDKVNLYTRAEWVRWTGTVRGREVRGTNACIKMTRAGRGMNRGGVWATFRYRPEAIKKLVEDDLVSLFTTIVAG